ncbi:MAG: hypothetical protein QOG34_542, partial [Frankiaceae bacterium]|nr:hypothetical protein [Frankiaceae bacterium]
MRAKPTTAVRVTIASALLAVLTPVTSALADPGDGIQGGCSFLTFRNLILTGGANEGYIDASAQMTTSSHAPDGEASVHCKIQVNGVDAPGTQLDAFANAAGDVQGSQQITFDDQGGTLPSALCEKDDWDDWDTTGWFCVASSTIEAPPPVVTDTLGGPIRTLTDPFEPLLCSTLRDASSLTGGSVFGVMRIRADGDL